MSFDFILTRLNTEHIIWFMHKLFMHELTWREVSKLKDKEILKNFRRLPLLYERAFCGTMEKYDMTQFEVDVLGFIHFYPEYDTAKQICELRELPKATVSVAVDRLTKKGYLYGERDLKDRRVIHLRITDEAGDAVSSITDEYQKFSDTLFSGFTETEKQTWRILEKKLIVNIENALRKKEE